MLASDGLINNAPFWLVQGAAGVLHTAIPSCGIDNLPCVLPGLAALGRRMGKFSGWWCSSKRMWPGHTTQISIELFVVGLLRIWWVRVYSGNCQFQLVEYSWNCSFILSSCSFGSHSNFYCLSHHCFCLWFQVLYWNSFFAFAGLVRSRDGSHLSPNAQPYISLPSPNIQSAKVLWKALFMDTRHEQLYCLCTICKTTARQKWDHFEN